MNSVLPPEEDPILLTEAHSIPRLNREKMTQIHVLKPSAHQLCTSTIPGCPLPLRFWSYHWYV
ncbi:UNVERIFIED_CONTAM: hypothetical protein GTU68_015145 [Idotea baltica]|nr:hypothetical protein [Idotea baltica]